MPRIKLTDRTLKTIYTDRSIEEFVDEDFSHGEFGVRVSSTGRKAFFLRYRVNGKRRRLPLGGYPGISLSQARSKALEAVVGVTSGSDPAKARQQYRDADTAAVLFEAFIAQKQHSYVRSTYRNYLAMWNKDCLKAIGDMKVDDVARHHIAALLDKIEGRTSGPHMANRTRTLLMSLFSWGVAKGRCKSNPVTGVPKAQKREMPGERFLSRDEIKIYWDCTEELPLSERVYWRLLVLLALRPGEVAMLQWSWVDGEVLTIPASLVKNKREHKLFLSPFTRKQIAELQRYASSEFFFPSKYSDSHQKNFTESHKRLHEKMDIPPWTPRDIRRTCETQMRTFIRDGEGVSRVLNHDISAIRKHYDRGDYFERKSEVLTKWTEWLKGVIKHGDSNVVKLATFKRQSQTI